MTEQKPHLQLPPPTVHKIPPKPVEEGEGEGEGEGSFPTKVEAEVFPYREADYIRLPLFVELSVDFDPRETRNHARMAITTCDVRNDERALGVVRGTLGASLQLADNETGFTFNLSAQDLWFAWELTKVRFMAFEGFDYDPDKPFGHQWTHDGAKRRAEPHPDDFVFKEISDGAFMNGFAMAHVEGDRLALTLRRPEMGRHDALVLQSMVYAIERAYIFADFGDNLVDAMRKACGLMAPDA